MKYATLIAFSILVAHTSYGQKTEYSAHLSSGGAAYRGASAKSTSSINLSDTNIADYTNNPYGKRLGFSYGVAGQVQRVTRKNSLLGVQAGYEVLRSRVSIASVSARGFNVQTTGHTSLTNQFINIHPFFGHRFALATVDIDLTAGPELGLLRRSHEEGKATAQGQTYITDLDRSHPDTDVRVRLNLTTYYKHIGLSLGYSRGLTDYYGGYVGGTNEVYSQVFRLGLAYRI
ncbi:outer membrane beta-barrel protein [Hymenobacter sp.]|uniref:outer membrane beta-barrel protein n=1 Tax=Hymenobacter sp. TaxID=1898978 RepID=UPI002ED974EA